MKERKQINLVCNSLRIGGAERQAFYLMSSLNIERLFLIEDDDCFGYKAKHKCVLSQFGLNDASWKKVLSIPVFIFRMLPFRREMQNSLFISLNTRPNVLNIFCKLLWGNTAILSERMNPSQSWRGGLKFMQKFLSAMTYRFADLIVVNSFGIKKNLESLLKLPQEKVRVIHNAIDLDQISHNAREQLEKCEELLFSCPTVLMVGRQRFAKGQWHIVRCFAQVVQKIPNAKLLIVGGKGEASDYLQKLVQEMKIEKSVIFLGEKSNPMKYMARADCFVFPSLHEGFPNVLLEALGCGCPIISSDCNFGPREILNKENDYTKPLILPMIGEFGILMPCFDNELRPAKMPLTQLEELWAESITKVLENHELRESLRIKSKARILDFGIEKVMCYWKKLINEFDDAGERL